MNFTANTSTYDFIDGVHISGLSIDDEETGYLLLQRSDDTSDNDGIYIELNSQDESGYNLIKSCSVSREKVIVDLHEPLCNGMNIEVVLAITDAEYQSFIEGMKNIFETCECLFKEQL